MSEGPTHVGIARARAGLTPSGDPPLDEAAVRSALAEVMDPELPMVSIVELGMVGSVEVDPSTIRVRLLPTFVSCPAIDLIRAAVEASLAGFGRSVVVEAVFAPPWSTDRISEAGLGALARAGIAPPTDPADVRCPYCRSARVVLDSAFGPTQCRSLFYCRECRQPFEAMKPV